MIAASTVVMFGPIFPNSVVWSAGEAAGGTLPPDGRVFRAEGLRLEIVPRPGAGDGTIAELRFIPEEGLTVGYRGTWTCPGRTRP